MSWAQAVGFEPTVNIAATTIFKTDPPDGKNRDLTCLTHARVSRTPEPCPHMTHTR